MLWKANRASHAPDAGGGCGTWPSKRSCANALTPAGPVRLSQIGPGPGSIATGIKRPRSEQAIPSTSMVALAAPRPVWSSRRLAAGADDLPGAGSRECNPGSAQRHAASAAPLRRARPGLV